MSSLLNRLASAQSGQRERTAITAPGTRALGYRELYALMGRVQSGLRALDFSTDSRVALVVNDGPLAASAFVAVAASAACAPLNPAYPSDELAYYGADLDTQLFLCDAANYSRVNEVAQQLSVPCFQLQPSAVCAADFTLKEFPAAKANTSPFEPPEPDALALLLHTSGTTSRPKIVPLTWRNLSASAANVARSLDLQEDDVCLNVMPLFHIHGLVACVLASLEAGGGVYCVPAFDGARFIDHWLIDSAATWYSAVPTIHQALVREARERTMPEHRLRFARSSSASLPPSVLGEISSLFRVPVVEAYGMTEAAHQMTSNPLDAAAIKPGSVGLPAGPEVSVMDEASQALLTQGDIGEVVIKGANVTSGYLANADANAAAFDGGWFRTGDQGYQDPDGYLFLTGRLKEIINRGGEKISPREVDEAALAISGVVQAVAFARPHPSLGEDLAMAVIAAPDVQLTPAAIRTELFASLAPYKVPSEVVLVAEIPKGPTGKLQRIGLAEKLGKQLQANFQVPRSELERIALSCLLGGVAESAVADMGVCENFFAQGGDSISGAKVIAELNDLFDIRMSAVDLFRYPAAELLAERMAECLQLAGVDSGLIDALCSQEPGSFDRYVKSHD